MMIKLSRTTIINLFPLFAALFLSVSVPLVHPALHGHSEHDRATGSCGDRQNFLFAFEEYDSDCPICLSWANSHLFKAITAHVIIGIESGSKLTSTNTDPLAKLFSPDIAPRAPPFFVIPKQASTLYFL